MVLVPITVDNEKIPLYADDGLYEQTIKYVKPAVQIEDFDFVEVVDGEEGSGKSVFAQQVAKLRDPDFNIKNICFTPQEFVEAVTNAKKNECIVFDEGFTGLSSRASLSEVNNLLVSLMMEMRQRNLFVIIVMPTVFMLDRYVVLHRAKGLFHVYMDEGRRGFWKFYNRTALKYLYFTGKKYYEYSKAQYTSFGRFKRQYTVNEIEYRRRKTLAFSKKRRKTRADAYKEQRDILLYAFMKETNKSQREMSRFLGKYDIALSHVTLNEIFHKINSQFASSED